MYLTPTIPHCSMSTLIGESVFSPSYDPTYADRVSPSRIFHSSHITSLEKTLPCPVPGLSLRVRLMRSLPARYRIDLRIKAGTHQSEHAVNKQLNDKERVRAALENQHLLAVVEGCLATAGQRGQEAIGGRVEA